MTEPQNSTHEAVRDRYAAKAREHLETREGGGCCGGDSCCATSADPITRGLYEADTPFEAALAASLGCGNPTALADLHPGDTVLDLGSGGGLDVLLSARRVAPNGHAYGLDMTDDMLTLARRNQEDAAVENATFLKGRIEAVPLPDASVDVIISNCVINLSPDKDAVLREAFRVLRPGGRLAVSDMVLLRAVPDALAHVVGLWTGCISGALRDDDYLAKLQAAGFTHAAAEVTRTLDRAELEELATGLEVSDLPAGMARDDVISALSGAIASAFIRAIKPTA